jgi:hypothetical protein
MVFTRSFTDARFYHCSAERELGIDNRFLFKPCL